MSYCDPALIPINLNNDIIMNACKQGVFNEYFTRARGKHWFEQRPNGSKISLFFSWNNVHDDAGRIPELKLLRARMARLVQECGIFNFSPPVDGNLTWDFRYRIEYIWPM